MAARAGPGTCKTCTLIAFLFHTFFGDTIVFFEWMFAETFEVICSMWRNIIKTSAFAFRCSIWCFFWLCIQVIVVFEFMIAKTFRLWTYHFAINPFGISPTQIQSIFAFLWSGESYWPSNVNVFELFRLKIHQILKITTLHYIINMKNIKIT